MAKRTASPIDRGGSSSSLSPDPASSTKIAPEVIKRNSKKRKVSDHGEDEFQQVTLPSFVDRYKLRDLGYGGDVYYQSDFITAEEATKWYTEVLELDTWYQPILKMYGKSFPQPRQIAAYSTKPNATLSYSGTKIVMHHPFPPALDIMRQRLEDELGVKFNHCMLNRYDDGSVYIGRHSDNLNNLVIASISLGAERNFILSPRMPSKARSKKKAASDASEEPSEAELAKRTNTKLTLKNGSLVVMQGRTQEYWKHEIPKEPSVKTGRISLTFRQLV